jgi:serine kinase of HPr protein (carbohydrate metabolism regulator)
MNGAPIHHAGLIAVRRRQAWRGVLITGQSGSGKSHLAMKALRAGWRLVADDRVLIWQDQGRVYGRAPQILGGLIEVRGLGVIAAPTPVLGYCQIALVAQMTPPGALERWPEPKTETLAGQTISALELDPFGDLSTQILEHALEHVCVGE